MAELIRHVHCYDDAGVAHEFYPGDDVPGWARERITNPKVWSSSDDENVVVAQDDTEQADAPDSPTPPPLGGPGSSRDAWAKYAESHGATVDPDASRDDIVDACREAGIRVE